MADVDEKHQLARRRVLESVSRQAQEVCMYVHEHTHTRVLVLASVHLFPVHIVRYALSFLHAGMSVRTDPTHPPLDTPNSPSYLMSIMNRIMYMISIDPEGLAAVATKEAAVRPKREYRRRAEKGDQGKACQEAPYRADTDQGESSTDIRA